jgi:hypothetical protein
VCEKFGYLFKSKLSMIVALRAIVDFYGFQTSFGVENKSF